MLDHPYIMPNIRVKFQSRNVSLSFNAMDVYDIQQSEDKQYTIITICGTEGRLFRRYTKHKMREVVQLVKAAKQLRKQVGLHAVDRREAG